MDRAPSYIESAVLVSYYEPVIISCRRYKSNDLESYIKFLLEVICSAQSVNLVYKEASASTWTMRYYLWLK